MKSIKIQDLQMTFELLTNLKLLVNEISNNEIKHIDPLRMKITLKGLIGGSIVKKLLYYQYL